MYKPFLNEANSYFRIIESNMKKNKKLGNKVLFSISSMVIEKYLVALLTSKGVTVNGHSTQFLIEKTKSQVGSLPEEINKLVTIDNQIDLCSLDPISTPVLSDAEMEELYTNLASLKSFVYEHIPKEETV